MAIFVVIVVNAVFVSVQESVPIGPSNAALPAPRRVTVRRDGRRREIDAEEVVVGDLLALESGDRVPADAVLVVAHSLLVDTSTFTGESEPSTIEEGPLFAGTYIVEGEADVWVTATGAATRLAGIARLTVQTASPSSPLTRELHRGVRTVAAIAVGVGGTFFFSPCSFRPSDVTGDDVGTVAAAVSAPGFTGAGTGCANGGTTSVHAPGRGRASSCRSLFAGSERPHR